MLKFNIKNQKITWVNKHFLVVSNSYEYLKAKFTFSADWEGAIKTAIFKKNDSTFYKILIDNECYVPWEILQEAGEIEVSVMAGNLITTNFAVVPVEEGGFDTEDTPKVENNVYLELISLLTEISEIVKDTKTRYICLTSLFEDLVINAGNSNAEIVTARIDDLGVNHTTLGNRLNYLQNLIRNSAGLTYVNTKINEINNNITTLNDDMESIKESYVSTHIEDDYSVIVNYQNLKERLNAMTQAHHNLLGTVESLIIEASESIPELIDARKDAKNNTYTTIGARLNAIDTTIENTSFKVTTLPAKSNLNTITETGMYWLNSENHTNTPSSATNGWLVVMRTYSTTIKQIFYRLGSKSNNYFEIYTRSLVSSEWSSWSELISDKRYALHEFNISSLKAGATYTKSQSFKTGFDRDTSYVISAMYQIGSSKRWIDVNYSDGWDLNIALTLTDGVTINFKNGTSRSESNITVKVVLFRLPSLSL